MFRAETLEEEFSLSVRRFSMQMAALFAAAALLLAGLGIYGTISCLVNEQSREIAIRFALGAQRRDILRMVLRQGLTLAVAGAGAGLAGALILSHLMAGLLYGVSPHDVSTFAGVTLVSNMAVSRQLAGKQIDGMNRYSERRAWAGSALAARRAGRDEARSDSDNMRVMPAP